MTGRRMGSRTPAAEAMYWVSTVTTVGLVMAVPAGGGVWFDRLWGTSPWLVIPGALVGFAVAMRFLLQLANSQQSQTTRRRSPQPSSDSGHVDEPPGS